VPPPTTITPRLPGSLAADPGLAHLAYHDPLTGLPNRAHLTVRLEAALERRSTASLALLSIDLDDFKLVNDGLGHAAGDELLRQLADRLRRVCRTGDLLARHGGDEFILLVELAAESDPPAAAATIASA
jgi:diguanylate cyclase (GGDEF)-like protein